MDTTPETPTTDIPEAQPVTETATPETPTVESLSGYAEGTVLDTGEIIKGTYDENGVLVGWHKEAPAGGTE